MGGPNTNDYNIQLGEHVVTLNSSLALSVIGHLLAALALIWVESFTPGNGPMITATGSGEGGGEAIEVSVVGASEWLRFHQDFDVAAIGNDPTAPPAPDVQVQPPEVNDQQPPIPLPQQKPKAQDIASATLKTDRPVAPTPDKPYAANHPLGARASTSAIVGVPGSPFPGNVQGGVGISLGGGGLATIAGGSEYGRRLQSALSRYYRLTPLDMSQDRFVIVRVRIDRTGRVRSLDGGRLPPEAYLRASGHVVIDSRVAAALLELDRHPIPFPPGFLPGVQEAVVDIYFQY